MSLTPRLQLPFLAAGQAQKHVTLNEALMTLDALCQLALKSGAVSAPPAAPAEGECYAIPAGATGLWAGKNGQIAGWFDGGWRYFAAGEGWHAWIDDMAALYVFRAGSWQPAVENLQNLAQLGIQTNADATTRFAVASAVTRFDHQGGHHRMIINKATATDTASLLFQRGYSGRAEIGLTGSDALQVKVSADGTAWSDVLKFSAFEVTLESPANANLRLVAKGSGSLRLGAGAAERLSLDASGHLLPLADNASRLGGAGARFQEIWCGNGVIQTSDAREKTVEARMDQARAVAMVEQVAPVLFRWNSGDNDLAQRLQAGFLAQEIKTAIDGQQLDFAVWGLDDPANPESRQWLRPDQLIPVLWAALKQTRNELAEIRDRLASTAHA